MAQVPSGKILRETRERKGYDLTTVARRLRIRPDILRAIEASDFSAMPPRGYTRNMINAYARLLGLNPTEIVNMYLDEAYAHQVERARINSPSSGFNMGKESRRSRNRQPKERTSAGSVYGDLENPTYQKDDTRRITRHLYDDRTQYSRDDYGASPRERVEREGRSDRDFMSHHSSYPRSNFNIYEDRRNTDRRRQIHVGQTPMEYSAPRFPAVMQSRLALIIAAIAIIILIIVLVVFVFNRPAQTPSEDVSTLPVSGINDTTGTEDAADEEDINVEVAPTSARIVYSVKEGDQVYIETYADGATTPTPEFITGPAEQTAETTGTWTITTFTPDLIEVLVNGEKVTLTPNDQYGGMYSYTVDFPAMLEQWRQTHTSKSSQRQAAVASAANAANQKSEDSASSSSGGNSSATAGGTGSVQTHGTTTQNTGQNGNQNSLSGTSQTNTGNM